LIVVPPMSESILAASAALTGVAVFFFLRRSVAEARTTRRRARRLVATRRTEIIDDLECEIVTEPLPAVRERKTGRMGFIMHRSQESDPAIVAGKPGLVPRWIEVQFFRKSDGKAGKFEWRSYDKFESLGVVNVDFVTKRIGNFRSQTYLRYPPNVSALVDSAPPS
jgi:hypothetical protein